MLEIKYTLNYKLSHRLHNCEININTRHTIIIKLCNYEIKLGFLKQKIQNGQNYLREHFVRARKTNLLFLCFLADFARNSGTVCVLACVYMYVS